MTSAFPVLLDLPLGSVLEQLPIPQAIKQALRGEAGIYHDVLELLRWYERGEWQGCAAVAQRIGLSESRASFLYMNSLEWARQVTSDIASSLDNPGGTETFAAYHPPELPAAASVADASESTRSAQNGPAPTYQA